MLAQKNIISGPPGKVNPSTTGAGHYCAATHCERWLMKVDEI
jgi:hypothetical protein